jgi:hypothetical protein
VTLGLVQHHFRSRPACATPSTNWWSSTYRARCGTRRWSRHNVGCPDRWYLCCCDRWVNSCYNPWSRGVGAGGRTGRSEEADIDHPR